MGDVKLKLDLDFFESVIMYKMLTDELYLATVIEHFQQKYFKDKNKQEIVGIIREFYLKRNTVPTIAEVKAYLTTSALKQSFKAIVAEFADFNKKFNEAEVFANTEQWLKEKAVFYALWETSDKCSKGEIDTSQILETMERACSITLMHDIGHDYFNQIDKHVADVSRAEQYLPTGWAWFDKKIGGGLLQRGRALYIFAGETNIGKSIFLGNIAANVAAQGKTVVLITLEMPEELYARRISAKLTKIPSANLSKNPNELRDKLYEYRVQHPNSRLIIKEFPPSTITPIQINAYLRKLTQMGIKPDLVVIDYINLLTTTVGTNSYEKVKYITEQTRALTYIYSCPIVSATQINRSGVGANEPGVETVSESMGLPATADVIWSIWAEDEDRELGILKVSQMKNRFGPNRGTVSMRIDYPTLTLIEDEQSSETDEAVATAVTLSMLSQP